MENSDLILSETVLITRRNKNQFVMLANQVINFTKETVFNVSLKQKKMDVCLVLELIRKMKSVLYVQSVGL